MGTNKSTETPWHLGYPSGGITGPNTPCHVVTVGEQCRYNDWHRILNNKSELPKRTHIIITKGSDTVAVVCGDVEGMSAEANAELIIRAVNSHEALLAALKDVYENVRDDLPNMWQRVEDAIALAERNP